VNLVEDDVRVAADAFLLDDLLQNDSSGAEGDAIAFVLLAFLLVESDLVADFIAELTVSFGGDSFGDGDRCDFSWLADEDSAVLRVLRGVIEKELWNLSCL
jgi:hypothetical protein